MLRGRSRSTWIQAFNPALAARSDTALGGVRSAGQSDRLQSRRADWRSALQTRASALKRPSYLESARWVPVFPPLSNLNPVRACDSL